MKRIMVVGGSGAGKSTLAREVAERLDLPVVHLDCIHWLPGWIVRDRDERISMMRAEAFKDRWVIDGNYSATTAERASRADLVVWLDLPIFLRLWRVLARIWRTRLGGMARPDITVGCEERLEFGFLWWIVTSRRGMRARYLQMMTDRGPEAMVRLSSPSAVKNWMEALR